MPYEIEDLQLIFDRTDGHCHICHIRLVFTNRGYPERRGAWEVEHSRPQSKGGTDHRNNLYAACFECNRAKSNSTTRTARKWNGTTRAPLSKTRKAAIREENTYAGVVIGGLIGCFAGPAGLVVGAAIGGALGNSVTPPKV